MKKITLEVTDEQHQEILNKYFKFVVDEWPQKEDKYWTISADGEVYQDKWYDDDTDQYRHATSNCFRTPEEAIKAYKFDCAVGRVVRWAEKHELFTPDWEDSNQIKFTPAFTPATTRWYITTDRTIQYNFLLPYFATEEVAERCIAECADDLAVIARGR